MSKLSDDFEMIVGEYMMEFCRKQEMDFDYWVGDNIGEVAAMGEYFFDFMDIKRDIDYDVPKGEILYWFLSNMELYDRHGRTINYKSYIMGLRSVDLKN